MSPTTATEQETSRHSRPRRTRGQRQGTLSGALPTTGAARICRHRLGPRRSGRTQPVLGCQNRQEPLQPDLRRARRYSAISLILPAQIWRAGKFGMACAPSIICLRALTSILIASTSPAPAAADFRRCTLPRSSLASRLPPFPVTSPPCRCAFTTAFSKIPTAIPSRICTA